MKGFLLGLAVALCLQFAFAADTPSGIYAKVDRIIELLEKIEVNTRPDEFTPGMDPDYSETGYSPKVPVISPEKSRPLIKDLGNVQIEYWNYWNKSSPLKTGEQR